MANLSVICLKKATGAFFGCSVDCKTVYLMPAEMIKYGNAIS
jgi:hypothetical protein